MPSSIERLQSWLHESFLRRAAQLAPRGGHCLELGTGEGLLAVQLARLDRTLTLRAVDLSRHLIARARANALAAGVAGRARFAHVQDEVLPFDDRSLDLVVCRRLPPLDALVQLREIRRVLKPSGALLLQAVAKPHPWLLPRAGELLGEDLAQAPSTDFWRALLSASGIPGAGLQQTFPGLVQVVRSSGGADAGYQSTTTSGYVPSFVRMTITGFEWVARSIARSTG